MYFPPLPPEVGEDGGVVMVMEEEDDDNEGASYWRESFP